MSCKVMGQLYTWKKYYNWNSKDIIRWYTTRFWWYEKHETINKNICIKNLYFGFDEHLIPKFGWLEDNKFGFIREALEQVSSELKNLWWDKVIVLHGKPEEIIPDLVQKYDIECIFTNTTYGTYGKTRDTKVAELSECKFESHKDFLLAEPHEVEQRKVFTPYYKLWQKLKFDTNELEITKFTQLTTDEQTQAWDFISIQKHPYFSMEFGHERLEKYIRRDYDKYRNDLDKDGTSRLSPYLRHWVFSVRQIYNKAKLVNDHYVSEMAWREFWWQIFYNFPNTKNEEFLEKYRYIEWNKNPEDFKAWCEGRTGYPVVDAAMKQLNETNWMHWRARMIVASFLTKDMHIDWRLWEQYFKEKLLDYDEAVNLWNWQWWASVWADPKPLRIFNPILQSEKFDPKAKYIKKYLPEVELESTEAIHNPLETPLSYCEPIVDHRVETQKAREIYKASYAKYEETQKSWKS